MESQAWPFKPWYQNANSHLLSLYVVNRSSEQNLLKYQLDSSCVIMFSILITTVFYKAVILRKEIWRWSLLGLKGLKFLKVPKESSHLSPYKDKTFRNKPAIIIIIIIIIVIIIIVIINRSQLITCFSLAYQTPSLQNYLFNLLSPRSSQSQNL